MLGIWILIMNLIEYFNAVLHWVKDHQPILRGMKKALKIKGRIVLQVGGKGMPRK